MAGFVLIGGSALTLRIQHRISQDLDLAYPQPQLPLERLEALGRIAQARGFDFQRNDHEAAVQEFQAAGSDLHLYQQDFVINDEVKTSFFTPDAALSRLLGAPPEATVRVGTLSELFRSKCLVSARRSKTRDWLDLYLLMRHHGFSIRDYQAAFLEADIAPQCDIGLARLCSGVPQKDDEGYAHLLADPPSLEEMTTFFVQQRNELEIQLAAEGLRRRPQ